MCIGHEYSSFQKKRKEIREAKIKFCNADADANADAEMPIPRFPNDH